MEIYDGGLDLGVDVIQVISTAIGMDCGREYKVRCIEGLWSSFEKLQDLVFGRGG